MAASSEETEFVAYVVELMQSVGLVRARRMFGGYGLFLDGLMFGLVADATLYLKVDGETEGRFAARGLEAFTYMRKGKACRLGYFRAPEEALEEAEEMRSWASQAYSVARRAASTR